MRPWNYDLLKASFYTFFSIKIYKTCHIWKTKDRLNWYLKNEFSKKKFAFSHIIPSTNICFDNWKVSCVSGSKTSTTRKKQNPITTITTAIKRRPTHLQMHMHLIVSALVCKHARELRQVGPIAAAVIARHGPTLHQVVVVFDVVQQWLSKWSVLGWLFRCRASSAVCCCACTMIIRCVFQLCFWFFVSDLIVLWSDDGLVRKITGEIGMDLFLIYSDKSRIWFELFIDSEARSDVIDVVWC